MKSFRPVRLLGAIILWSSLGFATCAADGFIHPGLLHTKEDLARIKEGVASETGVIHQGYQVLTESPYAKSDYRMQGPVKEWGRAPNINTGQAQEDAKAVYQNALMWVITGKQEHSEKAKQILNAWAERLEKVNGIDGVLASGLQGFQFANAAEIIRYTDAGWSEEEARRCERSFMEAWLPTIEHYAYFANGNWETAALQTKMAIAVFCNERELFEETVRYAVNGAGNGSIPHMVVYPTGQCQETTRAQHYTQLGLGLLGNATEVAWNQGVDLYGWNDQRLLAGFEYTAKYGLGEEVPFQHYLDRTGKYGYGGRNDHYTEISSKSRGRFDPIFERVYHHYANRRGVPAPYSKRVVEQKRPEGFSSDHLGLGTLTASRSLSQVAEPVRVPGVPSGVVARSTNEGIRLTWVRSVDPVAAIDAAHYSVSRSSQAGGPYEVVASELPDPAYHDEDVNPGELYYYVIRSHNVRGESAPSQELAACAGLPGGWKTAAIGDVSAPSYTEYNGKAFTMEGEGHDIGGTADEFHFTYVKMTGDGTMTARIIRPMSSQWTKPGVMMRETLEGGSKQASVLLLPHWSGALVTRSETGGDTDTRGMRQLGKKHIIKKNRLSTPYWVRLIRFRGRFTGFLSPNGIDWKEIGSVELSMSGTMYVGLPACSQLKDVATRVTYDSVFTPVWRMTQGDQEMFARPEPRWHKEAWVKRHEAMNARVKQGKVDLLFIGDSITHWWDRAGKEVWDKHYAPRNAVNLAISGDRTEHVLWRLENGNIDGSSPKLAVLMIGTNNHMSSPPEVTARDIRLIVAKLRKRLPLTKVLVLGIFPRGGGDEDGARQTNMSVNELISDIGDGEMVHYLDLETTFLDGRRLKPNLIPDGTHPSAEGYAAWAKALEPTIERLMK